MVCGKLIKAKWDIAIIKMASSRAGLPMSLDLEEGEERMRQEGYFENDWGWRVNYLIGPTAEEAAKIADVLKRAGAREPGADTYAHEEALMRSMAGQKAEAKALTRALGKKERDQVVRTKPHMAVGAVWTKASELTKSMDLLTHVGGNPGDD